MAFSRPTLASLIASAVADLSSRFPGADAGLRRRALYVIAFVIAGLAHGLYGMIDWVSRQILPATADLDNLKRHASLWTVPEKDASAASGPLHVTGADGSPIDVGARLQRQSDQAGYTVTAGASIAAGVATITVTADLPGLIGDASPGVVLTFVSPIAGVSAAAAVTGDGLTGGADAEASAQLLGRLQDRVRQQPQGGADNDYERWAKEVAGVTRAWCKPLWMGIGTVGLTFVCDDRDDIIPTGGDVAAVTAYLNDGRRPVTADLYVFAPTAVPMNFTIGLTPDTPAGRAAVIAALTDLLAREGAPGATTLISHIRNAVSDADGESDSVVSVPAANVAHAAYEMPTVGAFTWL